MNKTVTLMILVAVSFMMAEAQTVPTFRWGNLFDGKTSAGDQAINIVMNSEGNLYSLYAGGSTEGNPGISYAGEPLFNGYPYNTGSSHNNNLALLKLSPEGKKIWCVYSRVGEIQNSNGCVSATSDGGCVVMVKMRHSDGAVDKKPVIVDGAGNSHEINWTCTRRYYRPLIMKLNADGELQWYRLPEVSTEPAPAASGNNTEFTSEGFSLGNGTVDETGNIYIPFNIRRKITFAGSGEAVSFDAVNVSGWTGDSQVSCGDFLVVKLDANGNLLKALPLGGSASVASAQRVVMADNNILIYGYAVGNGYKLSAGSHSLTPSEALSPIFILADKELNISWAKCFPGEKIDGRQGLQNVNLTVSNGSIWTCGQFNLKISDGSHTLASTQGNIREGFILKLRLSDGEWLGSRTSRDDEFTPAVAKTGLTGYMNVLCLPSDNSRILVYGYVMNANVGVILREYDSETLKANLDHAWSLVTKGGVPTAVDAAYDAEKGACYITARGNNAFQPIGDELSDTPEKWGIYTARFDLPEDLATIIRTLGSNDNRLTITPVQGGLCISGSDPGTILHIYDISGKIAAVSEVSDVTMFTPLTPGLYIVNGRKYAVR